MLAVIEAVDFQNFVIPHEISVRIDQLFNLQQYRQDPPRYTSTYSYDGITLSNGVGVIFSDFLTDSFVEIEARFIHVVARCYRCDEIKPNERDTLCFACYDACHVPWVAMNVHGINNFS